MTSSLIVLLPTASLLSRIESHPPSSCTRDDKQTTFVELAITGNVAVPTAQGNSRQSEDSKWNRVSRYEYTADPRNLAIETVAESSPETADKQSPINGSFLPPNEEHRRIAKREASTRLGFPCPTKLRICYTRSVVTRERLLERERAHGRSIASFGDPSSIRLMG